MLSEFDIVNDVFSLFLFWYNSGQIFSTESPPALNVNTNIKQRTVNHQFDDRRKSRPKILRNWIEDEIQKKMPRISTNDGIRTTNKTKWNGSLWIISPHILECWNTWVDGHAIVLSWTFLCARQYTFILRYFIFLLLKLTT